MTENNLKTMLDQMLLVNQYDSEQEMKKYNLMHLLEKQRNYKNEEPNKSQDEKQQLAQYIHKNYNNMDEIEMKTIALKCLDINEIKKTLLFFELQNYICTPKQMSLSEFKNETMIIFNKYQSKAGGFLLEDNEWLIHDNTSSRHEVKENELLFENTINAHDMDDGETNTYLKYLIKRLNSLSKNIDVELRQKDNDNSKMISLLIWAVDRNKKVTHVIGL